VPDILITENIRGEAVNKLSQRFDVTFSPDLWKDSAELLRCVPGFRALIVRNQTQVTKPLLEAATKLIVVGRAGVGLENVDLKIATDRNILVTSTPDQNAISVAELAIGMTLALARKIVSAHQDTSAGNWNRQHFYGAELYGKTFGIVGAGKIGFLTACRARAFGMRILAYDPYLTADNTYLSELAAELVSLDDLLSRSDFISCHLPSTPETIGLLDARKFARMKKTAFFLNTARGEVVVEDDLAAALVSGTIAGAALDVRAKEPPAKSALDDAPNILLTPHIAAFTHEAQQRVTRAICEDVVRVLDGLPAQNAVNRVTKR
jgi:D-3-phosphoglycerate dehydrogenase / 2-oxoglutarate reductase